LSVSTHSALFLLEPRNQLDSAQLQRTLRWVRAGGRLVIVDDGASAPGLLGALGDSSFVILPLPVHVVEPVLLAPPVSTIRDTAFSALRPAAADVTVATTNDGPVLLRRVLGRGTIWLTSFVGPFSNQEVASGQNRRLVLNFSGPSGSTVVFEDVAASSPLGAAPSNDWFTGSVWGVALLFALVNAILFRWLGGRRLGPPVRPYISRGRPGIEYALSLASLLRRGQKRGQALLPYQRSLTRFVAARFGGVAELDPQARTEVEALLQSPDRLTEHDLILRATSIATYERQLRTSLSRGSDLRRRAASEVALSRGGDVLERSS
jgi:hypothetical protein